MAKPSARVRSSGRPKCRRPDGLQPRFCHAMNQVLIGCNERRSGIYTVLLLEIPKGAKSSRQRLIGVAARKSAKDVAIMFNKCPFCGGDILWVRKTEKGAKS